MPKQYGNEGRQHQGLVGRPHEHDLADLSSAHGQAGRPAHSDGEIHQECLAEQAVSLREHHYKSARVACRRTPQRVSQRSGVGNRAHRHSGKYHRRLLAYI